MNTRAFYDELFLNNDREINIKISLLSFKEERFIKDIVGSVISGELSLDGESPIRRTMNLTISLNKEATNSMEPDDISINKKARLYIGLKNTTVNYKHVGEIIWFNMGTFVFTSASYSHGLDGATVSITAQDKMALLDGSLGGSISSNLDFKIPGYDKYKSYYEILQDIIQASESEDKDKLIIMDVPLFASKDSKATANLNIPTQSYVQDGFSFKRTFNIENGSLFTSQNYQILSGTNISIKESLSPPQVDAINTENNTVVNLFKDIIKDLGQYEFYYDVDGRLIFQEKKHLKNNLNVINSMQSGDSTGAYLANFNSMQFLYDFDNKNIISSYQNSPEWMGIKNDFYIRGRGGDILYHIAIQDKINVPSEAYVLTSNGNYQLVTEYRDDWRQYIIDTIGYAKSVNPGASSDWELYYAELKTHFEYRVNRLSGCQISQGTQVITVPTTKNLAVGDIISSTNSATIFGSGDISILSIDSNSQITVSSSAISTFNGTLDFRPGPDTIGFNGIYKRNLDNPGAPGIFRSTYEGDSEANWFNSSNPKGNPLVWKYNFEIIDSSLPSTKMFSIENIGRRKSIVTNDEIRCLFPQPVSMSEYNFIIFEDIIINSGGTSPSQSDIDAWKEANQNALFVEQEFIGNQTPFISMTRSQLDALSIEETVFYADAFSEAKAALFRHTTFNETISVQSIPLYFIEPNKRILMSDSISNIYGSYYISRVSIPLSNEGLMSITATRIPQ